MSYVDAKFPDGAQVMVNPNLSREELFYIYGGEPSYDEGMEDIWANRGRVFEVSATDPDGDVRIVIDDEDFYDIVNQDCLVAYEPVKVDETPQTANDLLNKYAKAMDAMYKDGTTVPHLSALGLLVNFLLDYTELKK